MAGKAPSPVVTFIVRVARDRAGRLAGTIERVRTGDKERVAGAAEIGPAIERMLEADHQTRRRRSRRQEAP